MIHFPSTDDYSEPHGRAQAGPDRRKNMLNQQHNNRVLGRNGARDLTVDELGRVRGGVYTTSLMTYDPDTGEFDQIRVD
jgi:hypothetical protein